MLERALCFFLIGVVLSSQSGHDQLIVESIPKSGSIIAGVENETNILIQCSISDGNATQITLWRILKDGASGPDLITIGDPEYILIGEPTGEFKLTFNTNLTIVNLTADFDRAVLYCGTPKVRRAASFTIRIYRPPILQNMGIIPVVEGDVFPNGSLALEMEEAFPFPSSFSWSKDGRVLMNISNETYFGYPSLMLESVNRNDHGQYNLTASNYHLDNSSVRIGNATGGFFLSVAYGPEFDDDVGDISEVAILLGDPVTLTCGKNLDANPSPTILWFDSHGSEVTTNPQYTFSNGPGIVSLRINTTDADDRGEWRCVVTVSGNRQSAAERNITLIVLERPDSPDNVSKARNGTGGTFVQIQWNPPKFEGVPPYSNFIIHVVPLNMTFSVPCFDELNNTVRSYNVTGLSRGVSYCFTVTAVSEGYGFILESNHSNKLEVTTHTTVPLLTCSVSVSENEVITVSWNYIHTGGLNLTSVQILYRLSTGGEYLGGVEEDTNCRDNCSITMPNVTTGNTYEFVVNASNNVGHRTATCGKVIFIAPMPNCSVSVSENGNVTVHWDYQNPNITLTTVYIIYQINNTGENELVLHLIDNNCTSNCNFTADSLKAGFNYTFAINATNGVGSGAAECSVVVHSIDSPAIVIGGNDTLSTAPAPDCSRTLLSADGNVTIYWGYQNANITITTVYIIYQNTSSEENEPVRQLVDNNCTSNCSFTVSGLKTGLSYNFTINATNSVGFGLKVCSAEVEATDDDKLSLPIAIVLAVMVLLAILVAAVTTTVAVSTAVMVCRDDKSVPVPDSSTAVGITAHNKPVDTIGNVHTPESGDLLPEDKST